MNKDIKYIEEAYETILEKSSKNSKHTCDGCEGCEECKEKKLSPKQTKIAQAAPPPNKITGADFAALKKKKIKEGLTFNELYDSIVKKAL